MNKTSFQFAERYRWLFALVFSLVLLQLLAPTVDARQVVVEVVDVEPNDDESNEDGMDDDDGDDDAGEELVQNNPWGIDDRKMQAAQRFWFQKAFLIEVQKIKMVCELDKKQALKLKIASKGAAKKELKTWQEKWNKQMKQFQGMNFGGVAQNLQKKRKRKELVIEDADEIDAQTMQFLNNTNMFGGATEEAQKAIDSDFWRSTVKGVLTDAQYSKYKTYLDERKQAHISAKIDAFIAKMREDLALTDEQTQKYDALVRPSMENAPIAPGYYEMFVFHYYATKYNKQKMKAVLDDDQFQMMKMILGPSKAYGAMFDQQANNNNDPFVEQQIGGVALEIAGEVLDGFVEGVGDIFEGMVEQMEKQK
jgi:hypothetical protein